MKRRVLPITIMLFTIISLFSASFLVSGADNSKRLIDIRAGKIEGESQIPQFDIGKFIVSFTSKDRVDDNLLKQNLTRDNVKVKFTSKDGKYKVENLYNLRPLQGKLVLEFRTLPPVPSDSLKLQLEFCGKSERNPNLQFIGRLYFNLSATFDFDKEFELAKKDLHTLVFESSEHPCTPEIEKMYDNAIADLQAKKGDGRAFWSTKHYWLKEIKAKQMKTKLDDMSPKELATAAVKKVKETAESIVNKVVKNDDDKLLKPENDANNENTKDSDNEILKDENE